MAQRNAPEDIAEPGAAVAGKADRQAADCICQTCPILSGMGLAHLRRGTGETPARTAGIRAEDTCDVDGTDRKSVDGDGGGGCVRDGVQVGRISERSVRSDGGRTAL